MEEKPGKHPDSYPPGTRISARGKQGTVQCLWTIGSFRVLFDDGTVDVVNKFEMTRL